LYYTINSKVYVKWHYEHPHTGCFLNKQSNVKNDDELIIYNLHSGIIPVPVHILHKYNNAKQNRWLLDQNLNLVPSWYKHERVSYWFLNLLNNTFSVHMFYIHIPCEDNCKQQLKKNVKWLWAVLRYYNSTSLEELWKTTKMLGTKADIGAKILMCVILNTK
jgi:hypothetical protein